MGVSCLLLAWGGRWYVQTTVMAPSMRNRILHPGRRELISGASVRIVLDIYSRSKHLRKTPKASRPEKALAMLDAA